MEPTKNADENICIVELKSEEAPKVELESIAVIELLNPHNEEIRTGRCPRCGSPLYRIELTGELYCFQCKSYVGGLS